MSFAWHIRQFHSGRPKLSNQIHANFLKSATALFTSLCTSFNVRQVMIMENVQNFAWIKVFLTDFGQIDN